MALDHVPGFFEELKRFGAALSKAAKDLSDNVQAMLIDARNKAKDAQDRRQLLNPN
jgi:hypothetical protein